MELPRFRLPLSKERVSPPSDREINRKDVIDLSNNPLFQAVRAEIERQSLQHRLASPTSKTADAIRDRLLLVQGMEMALSLFDRLGPQGSRTTEEE
jgi:hypothetical protein